MSYDRETTGKLLMLSRFLRSLRKGVGRKQEEG
jgi:hypothetical protein